MPALDVLILNGASGTGKTSTANALTDLIDNAFWIHPDGLWDTSDMDPELILRMALDQAFHTQRTGLVVLDCQIRPTSIPLSIDIFDVRSWVSVLHTCPKKLREKRLLARWLDHRRFWPDRQVGRHTAPGISSYR